MTDSIRDRLKATGDETEQHVVSHGEHPAGDPVVNTHVSYHVDLRDDPARAKLAELAVAALFLLSAVGVVGFIVTYIAWPFEYDSKYYEWYTPMLGLSMSGSVTVTA